MRKTKTKVFTIESPIQIELALNSWVEKERASILGTSVFTHENKQMLLVTYCKNYLGNL
jgi:hypothetical protein